MDRPPLIERIGEIATGKAGRRPLASVREGMDVLKAPVKDTALDENRLVRLREPREKLVEVVRLTGIEPATFGFGGYVLCRKFIAIVDFV